MSTELFAQISSVNPLWDSGLQYGPGFRLCKKAYRTDTDAVGVVGPLPGEAVGWLVHPALADSMLHLTAVAPKPPRTRTPCAASLTPARPRSLNPRPRQGRHPAQ